MSWTLLYCLDALAIALFLISYYRNCYRRGYRIDFWHLQLFFACVFPNCLLLPAARSELNGVVVGQDFASIVSVLPVVFLITLLGFFAVLLGGSLWYVRTGLGLRATAARALEVVPRCSLMLMSSRSLLVFQSALCLLLQAAVLGTYFSASGIGFNLREYTFAHPALRPVALVASNYSVIIASHAFARYVETRERILLLCTLVLTFGLLFFGARSNLLGIYMTVFLCYLIKSRTRYGLFRIFFYSGVILLLGLYLGNLRSGNYSLGGFFTTLASLILFGNTFSDLRDFAWVYANWDHAFWVGKTYAAALAAFIPRVASHFRDTWGLGVATATTVGFDPQVHPGLRPGVFGEGYFNFGLIGVVLVGLVFGIISRRVDLEVKRAFTPPHSSMMRAYASTMLLGVAGTLADTAGFSGLYLLGGVYLFTWLCLSIMKLAHARNPFAADAAAG